MTDSSTVTKYRGRAIAVQRTLLVLVAAGLVTVLALLAYDAYNGMKAREQLVNCTVPGKECYEEGQKRTADAVTAIVEETLAGVDRVADQSHLETRRIVQHAAACADEPGAQTYKEIERCVKQRLKKEADNG
jgi:hypothetical protein